MNPDPRQDQDGGGWHDELEAMAQRGTTKEELLAWLELQIDQDAGPGTSPGEC